MIDINCIDQSVEIDDTLVSFIDLSRVYRLHLFLSEDTLRISRPLFVGALCTLEGNLVPRAFVILGSITSRCSGKWARTHPREGSRPDPGDGGNRAYQKDRGLWKRDWFVGSYCGSREGFRPIKRKNTLHRMIIVEEEGLMGWSLPLVLAVRG